MYILNYILIYLKNRNIKYKFINLIKNHLLKIIMFIEIFVFKIIILLMKSQNIQISKLK